MSQLVMGHVQLIALITVLLHVVKIVPINVKEVVVSNVQVIVNMIVLQAAELLVPELVLTLVITIVVANVLRHVPQPVKGPVQADALVVVLLDALQLVPILVKLRRHRDVTDAVIRVIPGVADSVIGLVEVLVIHNVKALV